MNFGGLKRLARFILPPAMLVPIERRFFRVRWDGNFSNWGEARAACSGYDAAEITARVTAAAREVREGRAVYERDGVTFQEPPGPWPALSFVREAARPQGGGLTVLDFGGALGGLYFQNRAHLRSCTPLHWSVVEQPALATVGRQEFATDELRFYSSVTEACDAGVPDVLLLAGVLSYVPTPFEMLGELLRIRPARVVLDRTGFAVGGQPRLMVQHVPRNIYRASYPCWFFNRDEFLAAFAGRYRLVHEERDPVVTPAGVEYRSFHFVRLS